MRALTPQMLALDDRLYDFDRQAETRRVEGSAALQTAPPAQRDTGLAALRTALDAQKAALREQQQALTELTQSLTRLLLLHRDYKRLLHDGYRFVRTNMFWLRTAEVLSWTVGRDMVTGALVTARCPFHKYTASSGGLVSFPRKRESRG